MTSAFMTMPPRCADRAWRDDLRAVLEYGVEVHPRGMRTLELVGFQSVPVLMSTPVVMTECRNLGYKFMAAEAAWILSGDDRVETIAPYSKEITKFSDDGVKFFGAYGPKVREQLDYVVSCLAKDRDSRQAVINIWREGLPETKDVPCTLSVQFLIRGDKLHCVDTMRSSDLWLGHPYDVFNFSMLSLAICGELMKKNVVVDLGYLYMNSGSKHIYDKNIGGVYEVVGSPPEVEGPQFKSFDFGGADELARWLWERAKHGDLKNQL